MIHGWGGGGGGGGIGVLKGRRKIDLIMLNAKLTLKGRGYLKGLGLTLRKK